MRGTVTVVDLADYCPQCWEPWNEHPTLDAEGRDPDGNQLGDPGEAYCRKPTSGGSAPPFVRKLRRCIPQRLLLIACLAITVALIMGSLASVSAASTVTGTWKIQTYSGYNQTREFSYPGKVNATLQPVNLTISGQRFVSIFSSDNSSQVYFSTSIGFYPAGSNFTTGKVNVSWDIPQGLESGAVLTLAVGLSGVKTPESSVTLTIKQNLTDAVIKIIAPIISGFQNQLTYLQQQLDKANAANAAQNFQSQQIEALEGVAIAGLIGYIVYDKRKKAGRTEEYKRSGTEVDDVIIASMMETAEPGEKAAVQSAANGGEKKGA